MGEAIIAPMTAQQKRARAFRVVLGAWTLGAIGLLSLALLSFHNDTIDEVFLIILKLLVGFYFLSIFWVVDFLDKRFPRWPKIKEE